MSEANALQFASELTAAAAAFRAKQNSLRETLRETIVADPGMLAELERRVAALESFQRDVSPRVADTEQRTRLIENAIAILKERRQAVESQPVTQLVPVGDVYLPRIEALEEHATASSDLVRSLHLVMQLAEAQEARTVRLEQEAVATHQTISSVMPALGALVALRQAS